MKSNGTNNLIPSPVKRVGFEKDRRNIVINDTNNRSRKNGLPIVIKTGKSPPPLLSRSSPVSSNHPLNSMPRYFHIYLLKRPEGLGINMMALKNDEFEAIIIAGQRDEEVSQWRMSNRELEERRKIQPGLEIVAINGKLLEPRTLNHAHHLVHSSDREIDLTVRRLSETESDQMMFLLQSMEEDGKVYVAKRPSQRNKPSQKSASLHFRSKKKHVVSRETFPYVTPSPPRSRQDYEPINNTSVNNDEAERRRKIAEKKGNKQKTTTKKTSDDDDMGFLDPTDALGAVGIDLDVYIDEQMMVNEKTIEFLEEQKQRTDEITKGCFLTTDKVNNNNNINAATDDTTDKEDSPPPNPTHMRKSLIKLLATLKQHQSKARDALVHIMSKEKILQKNLQVDKATYKRLMEESEEYILEAAQAYVELPGLSQEEKAVVWEACYNMLLEAKECDSIKRNVLSTLETIKDQVATVRDALYLLASEEKLDREAKLSKVSKLCEHSLNCKNKTCKVNGCGKMQSNIQHVKICKKHKEIGKQCSLCLNMETLFKNINKRKSAATRKNSDDRLSTIAEVKSFDDLQTGDDDDMEE